MHHLVVVTGATGHVGGEIARRLLARKERVRAVGRDPGRLKPLADLGAETAVGSLEDAAFLGRALEGAGAAFAMIPPSLGAADVRAQQRRVVAALGSALAASGVTHVVSLSSIGADLPAGTGPIAGLHELEQRLNALKNSAAVHLRAGFFMENTLSSIAIIKSQGINGSALRGDLPLPMIATRDIGAAAEELLALPSFEGKASREIQGPREYTMAEASAILGRAVGKPDLKYVQFPYDATRQALVGMGLSTSMADLYVEMARAFNEERAKAREPRSERTTTPTTLEQFSTTFAAAYRAA
ncbi:MAG: NmrA family NAD(P)-binding protein [Acidobacteriia bacterium]|nr:NmrA family NAD(P)-binding protein [Terriglobia bacterium]